MTTGATAEPPRAFLEGFAATWCVECHGGDRPASGLSLTTGVLPEILDQPPVLRSMRARLVARDMPPIEPLPDDAAYDAAIAALDRLLDEASKDPAAHESPRRVTARRLSRVEYEHTVRDLLGVEFDASAVFPVDEVGHGFDNNGDVLSVPPLLLEQYMDAAEQLATRAVVDLDGDQPPTVRLDGDALAATRGGRRLGRAWSLYSSGAVEGEVDVTRPGEYLVRARVAGQQAGPEVVRMRLEIDRAPRPAQSVEGERTAQLLETTVELEAGRHRLGAAFLNDYYQPEATDPGERDRNAFVEWIELVGPLDAAKPTALQRELHDRFGHLDERHRLAASLRLLASRAWRRPVTGEALAALLELVQRAAPGGSPTERLRLGLVAILVHPRFLFRIEPKPANGDAARPLDEWELASRLSYFLWASMPDETLRAAAANGELRTPDGRRRQVERMLGDARSTALAEHFATQWLQIRSLQDRRPDPDRFPQVDAPLREAMRLETVLFFDAVVRDRRPVWDLLTADDTFLNEALAAHYGVTGVRGGHMRRVALGGLAGRSAGDAAATGILRHASILLTTSNPTRTSPVKRGKWVLEALLDDPPPPAPPGVPPLPIDLAEGNGAPHAEESMREMLERHRADVACAGCHRRMDPLGFAMERFDAVGRWRPDLEPAAVAGELPDGRQLAGPTGVRDVLLGNDAVLRSLAMHLTTYALGRGLDDGDEVMLDRLVDALKAEPTVHRLVLEIVESPTFRTRMANPDASPRRVAEATNQHESVSAGVDDR